MIFKTTNIAANLGLFIIMVIAIVVDTIITVIQNSNYFMDFNIIAITMAVTYQQRRTRTILLLSLSRPWLSVDGV